MGGGGQNSLDSPKTPKNDSFDSDKNKDYLSDKKDTSLEEETEEYIVSYKEFTDYFTNFAITEKDLTGTGTLSDPYVVHSTNGFLHLSDSSRSGSLNNKKIVLNCDIVLNDEVFDEEGNPSEGDGVVFKWDPIGTGTNLIIDGQGHSIKGLYINNLSATEWSGLFSGVVIQEVSNLVMERFYINSSLYAFTIASNINLAQRIIVRDGFMVVKIMD